MKRYLLDSNIIISIWNKDEKLMDKILKENKIVILKEVLNELVVKETKEYRSSSEILADIKIQRKETDELLEKIAKLI